MKNRLLILICLFSMGLSTSCKKESDSSGSTYSYAVRLTDDDGPYDAVYIDLQSVEITGLKGKTVVLNVHKRIYNLLNFSNGLDTLIATGTCEDASVEQIRLILGPNNSVVVNNVSHPLSTPSAEQSGLKLQVHHTLKAGIQYSVLLDFDAAKSIIKLGNGEYKLKPVIRTIETAITGSIKGKVTPVGVVATVRANLSDNEYYGSNVTAPGNFQILGLPAGIYSLTVTPALPYFPVLKTDVTVVAGQTTDVGTLAL